MLKVDTKHAEYEKMRKQRKRLVKWLRDHGVAPLPFETVARLNEFEAAAMRAITEEKPEVAYNDELRAEMDILGQACSYLLYFVDPEELVVK